VNGHAIDLGTAPCCAVCGADLELAFRGTSGAWATISAALAGSPRREPADPAQILAVWYCRRCPPSALPFPGRLRLMVFETGPAGAH
jgi:hypothetical protein